MTTGVVGYFERPESRLHTAGLITISSVTGDAFVQAESFIATDNVLVCVPLTPFRVTSAFFIAAMINQQKWRYSYGRQCYKAKLSALKITLPWRDGGVDEGAMAAAVEAQAYWEYVRGQLDFRREGSADVREIELVAPSAHGNFPSE